MTRRVLFIFGSQACVPEDPLRAARRLGCATAVLAAAPPCGLPPGLVDHVQTVDTRSPTAVAAAVAALHGAEPLAAVVAYDDQAVPLAARAAAALGLPGNPVDAADASRDKFEMKRRFAAAGVPIAPHVLATDEDDAAGWAETHGYPVVLKPVRGSASQGVIRADSEAELRQAYRRLCAIVRDQGLDTGGRGDAVQLVETYLDGEEISVELLIDDGVAHTLCIFDKPRPLAGPFFEETLYVTPTALSPRRREAAVELAQSAASALGLRTGPVHCEIRLASAGPRVLEVGARLIGGACSRVFRHVLTEDIHEQVIRLALGERARPPERRPGSAGAMMLPIPRAGRLIAVRGVEQARRVPGVQEVILNASPGDVILPFPEQSCYVGFATAAAATPAAVERALDRVAELVELDLEPLVDQAEAGADCRCPPPAEQGCVA